MEGTPPELAYTPPPGFRGTTSFTFTVSDGVTPSAPATVTLVVGEASEEPGGDGASAAGLLLALWVLRLRTLRAAPGRTHEGPR